MSQHPDYEIAAAIVEDRQIDATPWVSSQSGVPLAAIWDDNGLAMLGVLLRDARATQDEPMDPAHKADLERIIGRPLDDSPLMGGAL